MNGASETAPRLQSLPEDIVLMICAYLGPRDLAVMRGSCQTWRFHIDDDDKTIIRSIKCYRGSFTSLTPPSSFDALLAALLEDARREAVYCTNAWRMRKPAGFTGPCFENPCSRLLYSCPIISATTDGFVAEWDLLTGKVTNIGKYGSCFTTEHGVFFVAASEGRISYTCRGQDNAPQKIPNAVPGPIDAFDVFESNENYYQLVVASRDGQITMYHLTRVSPLLPFPGMRSSMRIEAVTLPTLVEEGHRYRRVFIAFNGKVVLGETRSPRCIRMYRMDAKGQWIADEVPDWYVMSDSPHAGRHARDLVVEEGQIWRVYLEEGVLKRMHGPLPDPNDGLALAGMPTPAHAVIVKKSGTIVIKGIKDFKGIEGLKDSKLKHPPKHLVFSHIPGPFAIIDDTDHINVFRLIRTAIDKNGFLERTPDITYSEHYVFVGRFAVEGYCSWLSTCSTRTLVRGETDTHIVIHN